MADRVVDEYRRLNTREARAAFADSWIGLWAKDSESAWSVAYELLKLVEEEELYKDPRRVGPSAPGGRENHGDRDSYGSFKEYFEDRALKPFARWAELESTYGYVTRNAPELLPKPFTEANDARLNAHGGDRRSSQFQGDVITLKRGSTGRDYVIARLKRDDRPDLAERVLSGDLSANAAAIEAGFGKRKVSVPVAQPTSAAASLRKHMTPEHLAELVRLLQEPTDG